MIRALLLTTLLLVGCSSGGPVSVQSTATATPTSAQPSEAAATPSPDPTASATATATATPTATPMAEIVAPQIVGFAQHTDSLSVRIHNPNENHGLIRAAFELALLDENGTIIAVEGGRGVPGASCCTIYQLPPGGDFAFSILLPPDSDAVASLELTIPGRPWIEWSGVDAATVTIEEPAIRQDFAVTLTGRASVDKPGPFNVWVIGFADAPEGELVVTGIIECVTDESARAFEVMGFGRPSGAVALTETIAYVTTVEGHGDGFTPDC